MTSRTKTPIVSLSQESEEDALAAALTQALSGPSLADQVEDFLVELRQANRSPHTVRAYAGDLRQFLAFYICGSLAGLTPAVLRSFAATLADLSATSRARKQAALASFLAWAYRHDLVAADPMAKVERVARPERLPRPLERARVERILAAIPRAQLRDRLLFRLIYETGLRIAEALGIHVEDLSLAQDDERLVVTGKGNRQRTLLLDDAQLVQQLRAYLKQTGYQHGLLFRASKNGTGGPLRYQSVQARWAAYCEKAGVLCTIHQLRHSHATELLNGGASVVTVRKRLGQKNLQTTMLYAELSDVRADEEVRAARRQLRR